VRRLVLLAAACQHTHAPLPARDLELHNLSRCPAGKHATLSAEYQLGDAVGAYPPRGKVHVALADGHVQFRVGVCYATDAPCDTPAWKVDVVATVKGDVVELPAFEPPCIADSPSLPSPPPVTRPPRASAIAFSPDGSLLAAVTPMAVLLRKADLTVVADVPFVDGHAVVFSPDGKQLAVASFEAVRVFDVAGAPVGSIALSGVRLIAWGDAGLVTATPTDVEVWDAKGTRLSGRPVANASALGPDGKTYATGEEGESYERPMKGGGTEWIVPETHVTLFDLATGAQLYQDAGVNDVPILLAGGDLMVRGTSDVTLVHAGKPRAKLHTDVSREPSGPSRDGSRWAWVDGDHELHVAETATGKVLLEDRPGVGASALALSPDGHAVAISTYDNGLVVRAVP
jgi:prepilin-type processing-associated H-X9-DG protein